MLRPTITAVVPAYNASGFISRAIRSALDQTVPPDQVIVVDDGSADDTADVAGSFPVQVIRQKNGGPAAARNAAIRAASSEWIAFLDADDAWHPDKIERQIPCLGDPQLGVLSAWSRWPAGPVDFESLWAVNKITTSSAVVRKAAIEDAGYFDEDRQLISVEDYNLWLRIAAKQWSLYNTAEDLVAYTPAPGSLSGQIEKMALAELRNLEKIVTALSLDPARVRAKRAAICRTYGQEALHSRRRSAARRLFNMSLRSEVSAASIVYLLATFVPDSLLDVRRKLLHSA
jgi:glycosyltransferase involved in cell wall biosynthesis